MKIKNMIYLLALLPILMGGSCEKRLFEFTSNANLDKIYRLDRNGSFTDFATISDSDIRSFLDDLPKDAKVTDVIVKTLSMKIIPASTNEVKALSLSGIVIDSQSSEPIFGYADFPVPLVGVNVAFIGINNVIAAGLSKAKKKLKAIIMENQFGSFQLAIEGNPTVGSHLVADIHVRISIQIEYEECIEVWDYLEGGEECNL